MGVLNDNSWMTQLFLECGRVFNHLTGKLIMSQEAQGSGTLCNEEGLDLLHEGEGLGQCVLRGDVHGAVNQQPGYRRLLIWNIRAWFWQMM